MFTGGFILIVIGLLIWLNNMGIFSWRWGRDWPLILVILGIIQLISYLDRSAKFEIKYFRRKKREREEEE